VYLQQAWHDLWQERQQGVRRHLFHDPRLHLNGRQVLGHLGGLHDWDEDSDRLGRRDVAG